MGRDGYNLSAALIGMESYVVSVEEHLNQFTECRSRWSFGVVILQIPKYGVTHFHTTILHRNRLGKSTWMLCPIFTQI